MSPAKLALRKLSGPELKAAELSRRGAQIRSIIIQTGLSEQQIENAVALKAEWDAVQAVNQRRAAIEEERAAVRAATKAARAAQALEPEPAPTPPADPVPVLNPVPVLEPEPEEGIAAADPVPALEPGSEERGAAAAVADVLADAAGPAPDPGPNSVPVRDSAPDGPGTPAWTALATSRAVRAWASADGWDVPPPGHRLPGAIVLAYRAAHPGGAS